jgi:hypothetical protein
MFIQFEFIQASRLAASLVVGNLRGELLGFVWEEVRFAFLTNDSSGIPFTISLHSEQVSIHFSADSLIRDIACSPLFCVLTAV